MATDFQPAPTWAEVILKDKDPATGVDRAVFNPVWLKWFVDLTALLTTSGGSIVTSHNVLSGLQGGSTNEYYHVTQAEFNAIAAGINATITTAKLTAGGANGSITFTKGILTAQTPAT